MKKNAAKLGQGADRLVALRMTTIDQADSADPRLLPLRDVALSPAPARTTRSTPTTCRRSVPIWPRRRRPSTGGTATCSVKRIRTAFRYDLAGMVLQSSADVVSSAPELAR